MKKSVLAATVAASMIAGAMTGIIPAAAAETDDLSEYREISLWLFPDDYKSYYGSYNENPIVTYINEKFNCTLDFQQPPMGSEQEQFNLMLGTGEYTDIMSNTYAQDSVTVMYEDGIIRDLAPYIEKYMPNYTAFLNDPANEDVKKAMFDSEGRSFSISAAVYDEPSLLWGGMVYRRDILETMTGGYIAFPSGNDEPTTVEDWEYMLPLFKTYFEAAGMNDYACLILPYSGYFTTGEILNGFGTSGAFMVKDDKVVFGPTSDEFYNYLTKMHEWYENGWIYQDFASRTNDLFYLPNTALTYGAAAGMWFGLNSQLDGQMSMPEYGLVFDVKACASPLDDANGQDGSNSGYLSLVADRANPNSNGWMVSTSCSEENLIRFLTIADYFYGEEGAMIKSYGFNEEQAKDSAVYQSLGVDYMYTLEGDTFARNELFTEAAGENILSYGELTGLRLPGLQLVHYMNATSQNYEIDGNAAWTKYGTGNNFPAAAVGTAEESTILTSDYTNYTDYLNSMVPKFIMGTEELNEETWADFVSQMNKLGVEECTEIYQTIYDRYNQ